jgi:hypothetical protein
MIYLSGWHPRALPAGAGVMLTPRRNNRVPSGRPWAADTGIYAAPQLHDDDRYLSWLAARVPDVDRCLFATAPDVVGDAAATLERSVLMLSSIRALGYPVALVAQDGLELLSLPWDEFDCLFIGGTTAWKLGEAAHGLISEAKERGKWTHLGRVNSLRRFRLAYLAGCDSADGTHIAYRPDRYGPAVGRWIAAIERQPKLFAGAPGGGR